MFNFKTAIFLLYLYFSILYESAYHLPDLFPLVELCDVGECVDDVVKGKVVDQLQLKVLKHICIL